MIHDLLTLEAYFAKYLNLFGIKYFIYGNLEDILNRQNSAIRYPCFFVELFDERIGDEDETYFNLRLSVEKNANGKPRSEDKKTLNELRAIMRSILKQMELDSPQYLQFQKAKTKLYYKDHRTGDDNLIVFAEIEIMTPATCE
jgi:hypothetical protein